MVIDSDHLSQYFTAGSYTILTLVTVGVSLLGIATNTIIFLIFYKVYGIKRFQSLLWINMCSVQILQCFVMSLDALGAHVTILGDGEFICGLRYSLPICLDQVFLCNYLALLSERMAIVHFSSFHTLLPKLNTLLNMYGWSFGFTFLVLLHLGFLSYTRPLQCMSSFVTQFPQESVTFTLYFVTSFVIVASLVSVTINLPHTLSTVEKLRQEIEGKGVNITLFIGTVLFFLSAPRHILTLLFWMDYVDILSFQVASKITSIVMRLNVLLPFIGLMLRAEFRSGVRSLVTFRSLDPTRKKIVGQESYITTIQKMVMVEKKIEEEKRRKIFSYLSRAKSSSVYTDILRMKGQSKASLKPRNEVSLQQDEFLAKTSIYSSTV